MRVRFVPRAFSQLGVILSALAGKNLQAADGLSKRVAEIVGRLERHPYAFQSVDGLPGVRRAPLSPYPYIVFYRVLADEVEIAAVVHGAREKPWGGL
jgi:plasmid stabilization system protein ParE